MTSIDLRPATPDDCDFASRVHRAAMRPSVEQTYGWDETWQKEYCREHVDAARWQIVRHNGVDVGVFSVEDRWVNGPCPAAHPGAPVRKT